MRLFVFLIFLFSSLSFAAPDEAELGKAQGYPLCPTSGRGTFTEQNCLVGTYTRLDEIVSARKVAKPAAARPLHHTAQEPALGADAYMADNRNTGLLVLKGDTILAERYQYGATAATRLTGMSMTKTVVGMLIGVALNEGKIKSIDQKAEEFLPELKGHPYGETSLRHLLTMSSGVRFSEEYDGRDDVSTLGRRTLYHLGPGGADNVLSFNQRERNAGERFYYASSESEVLALVLRAATGVPLADYLSEKIWQPMGAEADATWLVDRGGYELGYMGINATLRDWGRFGLLLANDGALNGRQIIPAAWVRAATTADAPHLQYGKAAGTAGFGYQTWLIDRDTRRFALLGQRGQSIFVDAATKLVIVHTGSMAREEQFALFYGALNSL